jgi:hypothetical protein
MGVDEPIDDLNETHDQDDKKQKDRPPDQGAASGSAGGTPLSEERPSRHVRMLVSGRNADHSRDVSTQAGPSTPPADEPVAPDFSSTKMTRVAVSPMFSPWCCWAGNQPVSPSGMSTSR